MAYDISYLIIAAYSLLSHASVGPSSDYRANNQMGVLYGLEYSDMGETLRTTATKCNVHFMLRIPAM